LTEEITTNISLMEALISTGPRNLELTQKTTSDKNLLSTIRTRVEIPELHKISKIIVLFLFSLVVKEVIYSVS
jgi:hypothetical protein